MVGKAINWIGKNNKVLVNIGKVSVTTAAIGAAGAVAEFFGAPVVGVVGAGIAMSWEINFLDKKFKATENLKHGVNSMIKGIRGWGNERYNKKITFQINTK